MKATFLLIVTILICFSGMGVTFFVKAQADQTSDEENSPSSPCYMEGEDGELLDLSAICGAGTQSQIDEAISRHQEAIETLSKENGIDILTEEELSLLNSHMPVQ